MASEKEVTEEDYNKAVAEGDRMIAEANKKTQEKIDQMGPALSGAPGGRDMVNHPPHYAEGGPKIRWPQPSPYSWEPPNSEFTLECIQVIRHIKDMRLANAMKYIWRVAFGVKWDKQEDIKKAIWYLNDWLENSID